MMLDCIVTADGAGQPDTWRPWQLPIVATEAYFD
jgi:hypothetical protein